MSDQKRWHRTHHATEGQPMVWKLKGGEAIAFGFSLVMALFLFKGLTANFGWGFLASSLGAALLPTATLAVLLTLVVDQPKKNLRRFLEWLVLERMGQGLLLPVKSNRKCDES